MERSESLARAEALQRLESQSLQEVCAQIAIVKMARAAFESEMSILHRGDREQVC